MGAKGKAGAKGGLKVKIGLHGKAGGKAKVKAKPTGTCPMAVKFGFQTAAAYERKDRKVCKSLKQTCCTASSLNDFGKNFKTWMKQTSKTIWTLTKMPTVVGVMLGNLSGAKCAGGKKDDKKPVVKKDDKKKDEKDLVKEYFEGGANLVGGNVRGRSRAAAA